MVAYHVIVDKNENTKKTFRMYAAALALFEELEAEGRVVQLDKESNTKIERLMPKRIITMIRSDAFRRSA